MRIGLQTELFTHSSEAIMWRHLAREWIELGHEVFIKINDRHYLPKDITGISKDFPEVCLRISNQDPGNLDVFYNFFDLFTQDQRYWSAKLHSGIFSWGLLPLDPKLVSKGNSPLFIAGSNTYNNLEKHLPSTHRFQSGVDHNIFNSAGEKIIHPYQDTIFLWVGLSAAASCPDIVLEAYLHTFSKKDHVLLQMIDPTGKTGELRKHISNKETDPEVQIISGITSPQKVATLMKSATALIQPVRFHTECKPILEAMSCKLPIVTNLYSASKDFLNYQSCISIPYTIVKVMNASKQLHSKYRGILATNEFCDVYDRLGFEWAESNVEDLKETMLSVHKRDIILESKIEKAYQKSLNYNWRLTALDMETVTKEYL